MGWGQMGLLGGEVAEGNLRSKVGVRVGCSGFGVVGWINCETIEKMYDS